MDVAVKSVDLCRDCLERAVGVKRDSHGELAGEIFVGKDRFAVGGEHLGNLETDRYGNVLVVFNGYRYARTVFFERSGPIGDSGLEVLRIGLGNLVDDTRGEIQKCDDAVVFERYVSFAADERYVSVKRVGYWVFFKIRHDDVENEFRLIVFDAGHYFIESDTYVIGNYFCICDLYTVFAGLVFDQFVGGFGCDRTAGGVVYRYGVLYRAVGFITRQRALPEIVRSVYVVNVERVAPGAVFALDPLVGLAGVANALLGRGFGFCGTIFAAGRRFDHEIRAR